MTTAFWLQCSTCGGDSMSLLNMDEPDLCELAGDLGLELLWHPSLDNRGRQLPELIDELCAGRQPLDILLVEGFVTCGPDDSGGFDTFAGTPKLELVRNLAARAGLVIAVGTCACFGGLGTLGETGASGLQFLRSTPGGVLPPDFRSGRGLPVINLPGCPVHPDLLADMLNAACTDTLPALNRLQAPQEWFSTLVHQGCTRNEYHEYRVEDREFGGRGCMFFHLGCRGPLTWSPCNKQLWHRRNSKTNAGVPCLGCTDPEFPRAHPFFETPNIVDVPLELPNGVHRAHYLAYKSMAAAAAPERLQQQENRV
jgi:hydrogenase small subunit